MIKPRPLNPGSVVRLVAPSSPFDTARFSNGVKVLTDIGLIPVWDDRVFQKEGYLAGPDQLRALELVDAFGDLGSQGIIAIRGGFGVTRILNNLAKYTFDPKFFMGFSDLTALLIFMCQKHSHVMFHGPNVLGMPFLDSESLVRLRATLFGNDWETTFTWAGLKSLRTGTATGRLIAGNLTMICALAGTANQVDLDGSILVIEEVGEAIYRVDRLLTQLSMQVQANKLAGVVIGNLGVSQKEQDQLQPVLESFANRVTCPVVTGFPSGHEAQNHPIPLGVIASLDANLGLLRVLEDPFERN